jgi:hypothetical protein
VRDTLIALRERLDISKWETTFEVRIEEGAIPHSHPVLTLGTGYPGEGAVLSSYLHEQIHWWTSKDRAAATLAIEELRTLYPAPPIGLPEGARDEGSTYLHYLVNFFELMALADLLGRETADRAILSIPFYTAIYETVVKDAEALGMLFARFGLVPP